MEDKGEEERKRENKKFLGDRMIGIRGRRRKMRRQRIKEIKRKGKEEERGKGDRKESRLKK